MKYKIIHVELENYETRLWRDIAISGNPTLMELGTVIASSMQSEFDDDFIFASDNTIYMSKAAMENHSIKAVPLENSHLGDLSSSFTYTYDLTDQWVFNCDVHGEQINVTNMPFAFVKDGYGQGLFESDKDTFDAYMNGTLKPEDDEDTFMKKEQFMYDMPYNMDFECLGDFEKPLNLDNMRYSKQEVKQTIRYIEEHHNDIENIPDFDEDYYDVMDDDDNPYDLDFFDSDDIPSPESFEHAMHMTRMLIAYDIFTNEDINKEFRRLNRKYDMTEVYDMITAAILEQMLSSDSTDDEVLEEERLQAIKKLK